MLAIVEHLYGDTEAVEGIAIDAAVRPAWPTRATSSTSTAALGPRERPSTIAVAVSRSSSPYPVATVSPPSQRGTTNFRAATGRDGAGEAGDFYSDMGALVFPDDKDEGDLKPFMTS